MWERMRRTHITSLSILDIHQNRISGTSTETNALFSAKTCPICIKSGVTGEWSPMASFMCAVKPFARVLLPFLSLHFGWLLREFVQPKHYSPKQIGRKAVPLSDL